MHIIKATLAITAAGCLSLITVYAAERGDSSGAQPKHSGSKHQASTRSNGAGKGSSNRSARLPDARSHHASIESRRSHNRQRAASKRDATRSVNDSIPPDANIQIELPRRESENENDNEAEDDDKSSILLGGGTEDNDQQP